MSARGGAKVLEFPRREPTSALVPSDAPPMEPVYFSRCVGGCGALVTSPSALCFSCAVEDTGG